MSKLVLPLLICSGALLVLSVLTASADSVTLNSGEKIDGKIITETDTRIILDVQVASGITDQRTVARSDVKTITKTTPDEIAFQGLKGYKVGPDSLNPADYVALIRSLTSFQTKFPASLHNAEVQADLDALNKEKARVEAGDLKFGNRWYTAKEAAQEKYEIGAKLTVRQMRDQMNKGDTIGALNTFDSLERYYRGASVFPDTVETAIGLIQRLDAEVDRAVALSKLQETQFNSGIVLVAEPQKSEMIAARKRQIAGADAALTAADRAGVKWKPLLPISDKSPQALKATIAAETQRLGKLPLAAMRSSLKSAEAGYQALMAGNIADAEASLKQAETLWKDNQSAKEVLAALTARKVQLAATPTPSPTPSATPPKRKPKYAPTPAGR